METLINLFSYYENEFIHLSTWIAGKKFGEALLLQKEDFYAKRDYHDLYVQSDTLCRYI